MNSSTQKELDLFSRSGFELMAQGFNTYLKVVNFWMEYAKLLRAYQDFFRNMCEALPQQTGTGATADFPRLQQEQFNAIARSWTDYIKQMGKAYTPDVEKSRETS